MRKRRKVLPRLAAAVTVLMLLNMFTFVLTAQAILQISDTTPVVELEMAETEAPAVQTDPAPVVRETEPAVTAPAVNAAARPGASVYDADKTWGKDTEIEIFHAYYDETGEVTVETSNGDSLIAPGTGDKYYFHVKNTGNTRLKYDVKAEASVHFTVNDQDLELPLEVRFYNHDGDFFVGTKSTWEPLEELDGVKDSGSLSANHYAKYTLQWQWPFEGDDTLDTMLGNMAAEGDEISVRVKFHVNASADSSSSGGGLPQTGDSSNIALWAGLFVCSGFGLVILLFGRRKEEEDAKT